MNLINTTNHSNCTGMALPWNSTACSLGNKGAAEIVLSTPSVIGMTILNCMSLIPGSIGNILVLLSVATNEYLQTVPDLFIASLAFADLIVTMIQQPMSIYRVNNDGKISQALTNALDNLGSISLTASISSMLAVTIDRLLAIRRPFQYVLIATRKKALIVIAGLWMLSLALGFSTYAFGETSRFILWGYFCVSLILITIVYLYIFIIASKQENKIVAVQAQVVQQANGVRVTNQKRERKAAKTIAIVVGVFVIFWVPFLSYTISQASHSGSPAFMRGFFWVWSISMCNSAINPYIYCARNRRYRLAFLKLLGRKVVDEAESIQSNTRP